MFKKENKDESMAIIIEKIIEIEHRETIAFIKNKIQGFKNLKKCKKTKQRVIQLIELQY